MSFEKTPSGTRGSRAPSRSNAFTRFVGHMMIKSHRRNGDRFMGMDVLAPDDRRCQDGAKRQTPLARFPDGERQLAGRRIVGRVSAQPQLVSQHRGASRSGLDRGDRSSAPGDR